jgi:hypothetical protein
MINWRAVRKASMPYFGIHIWIDRVNGKPTYLPGLDAWYLRGHGMSDGIKEWL